MALLAHFGGLSIASAQGVCPPIGSAVGDRMQGDVNCDTLIDAKDALVVLWHVLSLPLGLPGGCGGP